MSGMSNTNPVGGAGSSPHALSRRSVLRGLGVSLALPWLEMTNSVASAARVSAVSDSPTRMAFVFVPNGVHLPAWTPKAEGYGFDLPRILQPLTPVKDQLMVLSGLTHDKGRANGDGPGDHARCALDRRRFRLAGPSVPADRAPGDLDGRPDKAIG